MDQGRPLATTLLGILDNLSGGVSLVDADLRYLYINATLAGWYARPVETVIGRRLGEILPAETMAGLRPALEKVLAGTALSIEERLTYPDGKTRWVKIDFRPQADAAGKVWGYASLLTDITRRREAEEALLRSEARYREAEKIAGLGHWRWFAGPDGQWAGERNLLSVGAGAIYGLELAEDGFFTDSLLVRNVHPDDRQALAELYEAAVNRRLPRYSTEYRLVRPDGSVRHVREVAENVFDAAGRCVEAFGTVLDITALKETENLLRARERHYRQAERLARLGHWHWIAGPDRDWSGGTYFVSDSAAAIYGWPAADLAGSTEGLIDRTTHPDDLVALRQFFAAVQRERQRDYTVDYRLLRPDGGILFVRESAENVFDAAGGMIESFGIVQDVTEQKEAERQLQESEARLNRAQRIANIGSWESNLVTGRLTWSDQTFHLFGLTPGEMDPREAIYTLPNLAEIAALDARFKRTVTTGMPYAVDYHITRPDGESRMMHEEAVVQRDASGRAISVMGTVQDVTEQRRQERALREGQDLLEIGQRLANMGSFEWNFVTGRIRWSSQMWRIHQLEPQEFAPSIADNLDLIHPADRALFLETMERITATGAPYEIDFRLLRPDGETRVLHEIGAAALDAAGRPLRAFGSTQDVTDLRRAEAALLESESRLKEAQHLARMGNWEWVFADDSILRSEGYAHLFGMAVDAIPAQRGACLAFVHAEDRERLTRALAEAARTGGGHEIDFRILRPDGAERILHEAWVVHLDGAGRPARLTGIAQDVTEQRLLEHALNRARLAADLASLRKSAYLANMSHELRTPLNAIIGFADLLGHGIAGELKAKQAEYIGDIHGAALHLKDVINDVLDLSKIEAGQFELDERALAIDGTITHCLDLVRYQAQTKRLNLLADIAPGLPVLRADELALKKVLINLLSNAIKFTPEGGTVGVAAGLGADGALLIQVRDTGIGIAAGDLERVLQPFSQVHDARIRRQEGTGLGLAIARALAERHGGTLGLASAPGQGTTVTLHLPPERLG